MQQHNGQHILSAAFVREASSQTLSFHLGATTSTIDLDHGDIPPEIVSAVEREANRVVRQGLPIRSYFIKADEAARLKLRKAPEAEGILRIVDVEGFDRQACCGTHPKNTAEVGPILIRGSERFKGGTRVSFVCGERALADYKATIERVRSLIRVLNSSEESLVDTATKLVGEKKELIKTIQALREEILHRRASTWMSDAETVGGFHLVVREVEELTPGDLRLAVIFLTKEPSRLALLGTRSEGRAHLVFGRSANVPSLDMTALLREALPSVEGHGGGSPQIAQGGGPRLEGLNEALENAHQAILDL
jgi:alanyl-tRNA synthetase